MRFTTGTLTRCAGGNHYELPITIGGNTRTLRLTKDEAEGEPPANIDEARDSIISRLRSAYKELDAVTFADVRTAVSGKTFKV